MTDFEDITPMPDPPKNYDLTYDGYGWDGKSVDGLTVEALEKNGWVSASSFHMHIPEQRKMVAKIIGTLRNFSHNPFKVTLVPDKDLRDSVWYVFVQPNPKDTDFLERPKKGRESLIREMIDGILHDRYDR